METKPAVRNINLPLILKKKNMTFLNANIVKQEGLFTPSVKVGTFREDVLHQTTDVYFLKGEFQRMTLVNRQNLVTKCSRTIARYFSSSGAVLEKTSDQVTQIIGQEQYKTVFTALCSIIDQELKIRSILALLTSKSTTDKKEKTADNFRNDKVPKECTDQSSQTDEMRIPQLKRKPQRRIRRQPRPYIVQDLRPPETKKIKKVVINITRNNTESSTVLSERDSSENSSLETGNLCSKSKIDNISKQILDAVKDVPSKRNSVDSLQDLGYLHDEYSNESIAFSTLSDTPTHPDLITNPSKFFKNVVDQHTKDIESYFVQPRYKVRHMDGTDILVPSKPEDVFHIATKENLQYLDEFSRKKLLEHQMRIDHKHCLTVLDEDGNLPIHMAVLNNDLELLSRQCVVLKIRNSSIDTPASNGLTALKLSLHQEAPSNSAMTSLLLRHGADPLQGDEEHRAVTHIAAERDAALLRTVLKTCCDNVRKILYENEDLWKPEMEQQSDEMLSRVLMKHMCSMYDKQGYTPLMLASMLGLYENVRVLLEHSPRAVNDKMPTSGNTALYLAVAAACNCSTERGNKSKVVEHYAKTIETLLENGADPDIDNHSGTNVNVLLTEYNSAELSMLVANKMTRVNLIKNEIPDSTKSCDKVMLYIDKQGMIEYKDLVNAKKNKTENKIVEKKPVDKTKPHIVENILLKSSGNTVQKNSTSAGKILTNNIDRKSTKIERVNAPRILIRGKLQKNNSVIVENKKKVLLPSIKQEDLKRKASYEPNDAKQAKIEK